MSTDFDPVRYSVITEKNPREIVMLRGSGCKWRRCKFCDYHLDHSKDETSNYAINQAALSRVRGIYGKLEVINSGSLMDLDQQTLTLIRDVCLKHSICELHFECHWMHRKELPAYRAFFTDHGIAVKVKIGVETFDAGYREQVLDKGIGETDPSIISEGFDEVCLLFGLSGQTVDSMKTDIETGLTYFERVCVNLMIENSTSIKPDETVRRNFMEHIYPFYRDDPRVDILLNNTDFGVGKDNQS